MLGISLSTVLWSGGLRCDSLLELGWHRLLEIWLTYDLIVLSSTYRMQNAESRLKNENVPVPTNLSAFQVRRRRLSAEELRDALMLTNGQLDPVPGNSESGEFLISKSEDINAMIRPNRVGADDDFYTTNAAKVDLPIAALLRDLKARGMLNDTLVVFATEFGRPPAAQGTDGRDHHPAHARPRPREAHLPPRRLRLPPDRCTWPCGEGDSELRTG